MAPRKNYTEPRVAGATVVGLFADQPAAERGIQALKAAGFSDQQIGVAVRDKQQQEELTEGTAPKWPKAPPRARWVEASSVVWSGSWRV